MLKVAGAGELADVFESSGEWDILQAQAFDDGVCELVIVSGNFDFGMTSGAEFEEHDRFGEGTVIEAHFTKNDFVHRSLVHGHFSGVLGGPDELVDHIKIGLCVPDDQCLGGGEMGGGRAFGKGNSESFEKFGEFHLLDFSGRWGDKI